MYKIELFQKLAEMISHYPKDYYPQMYVMIHHWKGFHDVYVVKIKSSSRLLQHHFFDGDFNLISQEEGEMWIKLVTSDENVFKKRVLRSSRVEAEALSSFL